MSQINIGWSATVKVRNRRVAQDNPGAKKFAIGLPCGESFVFEVAADGDATKVRNKLLDWLFAHLEDSGVELPEQDARTDY